MYKDKFSKLYFKLIIIYLVLSTIIPSFLNQAVDYCLSIMFHYSESFKLVLFNLQIEEVH